MSNAKAARVADVVSEYVVVLNVGARDGVNVGDKFLVYAVGAMVKDPDTGEELEAVEVLRGKVKVVHVQKAISTAETFETDQTPGTIKRVHRSSGHSLASMFGGGTTEETEVRNQRLSLREVQIGDFVRPIK
jgi:hypothetical protein